MRFSPSHLLCRLRSPESEPESEFGFERALTDNALRTLGRAEVPRDLALRIRLQLSHERVRRERRILGRLHYRAAGFLESYVRPAGVRFAVVSLGLLSLVGGLLMLGAVAPQQTVEANEEPLAGFSGPRYLYSAAGEQPLASVDECPLIVKAMVDSSGRVYDYKVLSGQLNAEVDRGLRQRMLTGVFQPAHVFGQPVRGSVVLTFTDVVVRG